MTLIKFNNRNRLFPWDNGLKSFLSNDNYLNDDFLDDDNLMPAMNVKEHQDDFEIEFAAPGFNKKDFNVTLEDDMLHVSAEKTKEEEEKEALTEGTNRSGEEILSDVDKKLEALGQKLDELERIKEESALSETPEETVEEKP